MQCDVYQIFQTFFLLNWDQSWLIPLVSTGLPLFYLHCLSLISTGLI